MNRNNDQHLAHYGIKGMKWGVRRYQNPDGSLTSAGRKRYRPNSSDSSVTKKVKKDLASLSASEFRKKYGASNTTYMKRVERYGDPYMNAPLAKLGKFMEKQAQNNANRYMEKANAKAEKEFATTKNVQKVLGNASQKLSSNKEYLKESQAMYERIAKTSGLTGRALDNAYQAKMAEVLDKYMKADKSTYSPTGKTRVSMRLVEVNGNNYLTPVVLTVDDVKHAEDSQVFGMYIFNKKGLLELIDDESFAHVDKDEFLAHYGVLGMKWGIRRYQNRDGTRTAAGKLRERKAASKDHKTAKALKKKPLELLTNEELQTLNRRLQLETQYKNLRKQNVSRGRQFVSKMVTSVATEVIRNELSYAARKAINANRK